MMPTAVREYDAKPDAKKRVTLRAARYKYYHVTEYDDGQIILEPRELTAPLQISRNTLAMMDSSVKNLKSGEVSAPVDLSEFA